MEIIAKTSTGCLISATSAEVTEILRSVTGKTSEKLEIGQKIPAIDYASSITKIKELGEDYAFTNLESRVESFKDSFEDLACAIKSAASLEV